MLLPVLKSSITSPGEHRQCVPPVRPSDYYIRIGAAMILHVVTLQLKARFEMLHDEGIATIARGIVIAQICTQIAIGDIVFLDSCIELGIKFVLGDPCLAIEGGVILLTSVGSMEIAISNESLGGTSPCLVPIW